MLCCVWRVVFDEECVGGNRNERTLGKNQAKMRQTAQLAS
jgi:hypothetical protein